jgi:hypothetical protein
MLSDLLALDRFAAKRTLIGLPVAKKAPATKQVARASKSLGDGLELDVEFAVGQGLGRRAVRWRARKRKRAGDGRGRHRANHDAARRGIIKLAAALGGSQHVAGTGRARATQGVGAYCFGHVQENAARRTRRAGEHHLRAGSLRDGRGGRNGAAVQGPAHPFRGSGSRGGLVFFRTRGQGGKGQDRGSESERT